MPKKIEKLTSEQREIIFQQEFAKLKQQLHEGNFKLEDEHSDILYTSHEENPTITFKDTDLVAPPLRSAVTGIIGTIWFFGMLFMFGVLGLIWAFVIAFMAFLLLALGTRSGFLPPEWTTPYFMATCPNCHFKFMFFMNDAMNEYHPEQDHNYSLTCDKCKEPFALNYEYTGSYDAKWDKLR